jgi:hypothetical protein
MPNIKIIIFFLKSYQHKKFARYYIHEHYSFCIKKKIMLLYFRTGSISYSIKYPSIMKVKGKLDWTWTDLQHFQTQIFS